MNRQLFAIVGLPILGACVQPYHLQYDYGRAYTESMQLQANLDRPTAATSAYPLDGTEAVVIRANVIKQDTTEKSGKVDTTRNK